MNFSFHPGFKNWYPFYWERFKQSTRYTYILNDIKDHEALKKDFHNTLKRQIKKGAEEFQILADIPASPVRKYK